MQTDLIRPRDAAVMLGLTVAGLRGDRARPTPSFPYVKLTARSIRYSRSALQRLIAARSVGAIEQ